MQKIYLYIIVFTAGIFTSQAQNIYSGGRSDGFSFQEAGFGIYSGGTADGFASATTSVVALPVTFIGFTAQPRGSEVLLQWQTAMESNNDHFEVQRSANAVAFVFLTDVAGRGNSTVRQDYATVDPSPYPGLNYYRLKQVDQDGNSQYSKIVTVNMAIANGASLSVYPNPAVHEIQLTLVSLRDVNGVLSLYSSAGKLIETRYASFTRGTNKLSWNVSRLSAGIYYFRVENSDFPVVSFIKQ